jgi:hypothetical protein
MLNDVAAASAAVAAHRLAAPESAGAVDASASFLGTLKAILINMVPAR